MFTPQISVYGNTNIRQNHYQWQIQHRRQTLDLQDRNIPQEKPTTTTQSSKTDLKLFTRRFIHCFPMCEITLQIKQWPYSSPGFWEPPNRTSNESWSRAVDDIRCHLVAIITYYNMIDDCESSHHSGSRNCNITTTNLIQSNALIFRSQCFELARLNSNCVPQCFALCAHQTFQVFTN